LKKPADSRRIDGVVNPFGTEIRVGCCSGFSLALITRYPVWMDNVPFSMWPSGWKTLSVEKCCFNRSAALEKTDEEGNVTARLKLLAFNRPASVKTECNETLQIN